MSDSLIEIVSHPVLTDKISRLRDERTSCRDFRELLYDITLILGYEATRELPTILQRIETPVASMDAEVLAGRVLLVPILRAGIPMAEAMLRLIPEAGVGHIGLYRDHDTLLPVEYYVRLPRELSGWHIFILDPMLATGGSAAYAAELLLKRVADRITLISIVAASQGAIKMREICPEIHLLTGAMDEKLNEKGYIVPGLGDAGDRLYNTVVF